MISKLYFAGCYGLFLGWSAHSMGHGDIKTSLSAGLFALFSCVLQGQEKMMSAKEKEGSP